MGDFNVTAETLPGLVGEAIKQFTGMGAAEWKEFQTALAQKSKHDNEISRENTSNLIGITEQKGYFAGKDSFIRRDPQKGIGLRLGAFARASYLAKTQNLNVKDVAHKQMGYKWLADDIDQAEQQDMQKALISQSLGSGGALVPPAYSEEVIELLRAQAVVRSSGVREMPMPNGTLTIPRQATAGTASYAGEALNITASYLTTEQIMLSMKKLTSLSVVSNDLIKVSSPQVDALVRDDIVMVMALKEDITFLRGDGTQNTPKGLLSKINSANQFARTQAGSVSTLAEITNDLFTALGLPTRNNVPTVRPVWFMHSKTGFGLRRIRDSLGHLVFDQEMRSGTLLGIPYVYSNQIPTNLGGGSNKSEVYLLETSQAIIGDTYRMELGVFPNGTYYDGSVVQSGISQDTTSIRAVSAHDFALRHDLSGSVINTIDWGN